MSYGYELPPPPPPAGPPPPPLGPPSAMHPAIYSPQRAGSGLAVASMVLGICSIVFAFGGLVTLTMVILAVTFGGKRVGHREIPGRGMAIAGLVCGLVGLLTYLLVGIATGGVFLLV